MLTWFSTVMPRLCDRVVFPTKVTGIIKFILKEWIWSTLQNKKVSSKETSYLNMKGNIIKLLEEIIRVNLFDFGMDNGS